ncbi:hypothetical protein ABPG75_008254 [Micractinium tetrahymenae]
MQPRHLTLALLLGAAALCACQAQVTPADDALEAEIKQRLAEVQGAPQPVEATTLPSLAPPMPGMPTRAAAAEAVAPAPAPEVAVRRLLQTEVRGPAERSAAPAPEAEAAPGGGLLCSLAGCFPAFDVAASPAAEEMGEGMPMVEGVRKLLGTLTVNASRGDLWAYQSKTTTERTADPASGKTSVGRATGTAFAANNPADCKKGDCAKPVAQVCTTAVDAARRGDTWAVGQAQGSSYSIKAGGQESVSTSAVQVTAAVAGSAATFFGSGVATSGPYGEHPWASSRVDVRGRTSTPAYGYGR